jgi:hypothetical protein
MEHDEYLGYPCECWICVYRAEKADRERYDDTYEFTEISYWQETGQYVHAQNDNWFDGVPKMFAPDEIPF